MLSTMLADGLGVFAHPGHAARKRLEQGLTRELFIRTLLVTAVVSAFGFLLPEAIGVSDALDQVTGADKDTFDALAPTGLAIVAIALAAPTLLFAWRGPAVASRLSLMVGGSRDLMAAAVWIYLGTAASLVVTLGVAVSDVVAGVLILFNPTLGGWLALVTALIGTLAILSAGAALARAVLDVPGPVRALVLTCGWLLLALSIAIIASFPLLLWIA